MKLAVALLTIAVTCLVRSRAEPPSPYITTYEDSFAPPPPPIGLVSNSQERTPSSTYNSPRTLPSRGNGRHQSPKTTTAIFVSPTPRSIHGSSNSGYNREPIAIGVSPSSHFGSPGPSYGPPIAIGISPSTPSSQYGPPAARRTSSPTAAVYSGGGSGTARYSTNQYDAHSDPVNYEFAYSIMDVQSGTDFGHQESRQGDAAWGSYTVVLPDGRRQVVEYEADQHGFRPRVRYEQATSGRSGSY